MGYLEWAEIVGRGDSLEEVGQEENRVHGNTMTNPNMPSWKLILSGIFFI